MSQVAAGEARFSDLRNRFVAELIMFSNAVAKDNGLKLNIYRPRL